MPTYQYRCGQCKRRFLKIMTLGQHEQHPRPTCPKCGSRKVQQLPSAFQAVTGKKT
jgi:putative FmdB family regulatory protein